MPEQGPNPDQSLENSQPSTDAVSELEAQRAKNAYRADEIQAHNLNNLFDARADAERSGKPGVLTGYAEHHVNDAQSDASEVGTNPEADQQAAA